jgi:hypothetical protein
MMEHLTEAIESVRIGDAPNLHAVDQRSVTARTYCGYTPAVLGYETLLVGGVTCERCRRALRARGLLVAG